MSNEHVHPLLREVLDHVVVAHDNPSMNYWLECISDACESAGVLASRDQVRQIADDVKISHDNYGMAFPVPSGNPMESEFKRLKRLFAEEKEKVFCMECGGRGRIISQGPSHSSDSQCWKCHGEGKHKP